MSTSRLDNFTAAVFAFAMTLRVIVLPIGIGLFVWRYKWDAPKAEPA